MATGRRTWVFDKLLFGAGYTDRDKERTDSSNDWTNGSGQYGTLYQTPAAPCSATLTPSARRGST